VAFHVVECLLAVRRAGHLEADRREHEPEELAQIGVVIDDENPARALHGTSARGRRM
jgi:hypothetical protein